MENIKQKKSLTKAKTITIIVSSSVLAVVLALILTFSFVNNAYLSKFAEFKYAEITVAENTDVIGVYNIEADAARCQQLQKALKNTKFSVMQGLLEGKNSGNATFSYFTADENNDGEDETYKTVVKKDELDSITASGDEFLLVLYFDSAKTLTVTETKKHYQYASTTETVKKGTKTEIKYDTVKMLVKTTNGEIEKITLYAYVFKDMALTDVEGAEYRYVAPISVNANGTKLYEALEDLVVLE